MFVAEGYEIIDIQTLKRKLKHRIVDYTSQAFNNNAIYYSQ